MPTFPRSPLSFRTAGFPSTAGRLAYQARFSRRVNQLKPAPRHALNDDRFVFALRASHDHCVVPALTRETGFDNAPPWWVTMIVNKSERPHRIKEFVVGQKRLRVTQIGTMIAEFDRICITLGLLIEVEEKCAPISDPTHFTYRSC